MPEDPATRNSDRTAAARDKEKMGDAIPGPTMSPSQEQHERQQQAQPQERQPQPVQWSGSGVMKELGKSMGLAGTGAKEARQAGVNPPPERPSPKENTAHGGPAAPKRTLGTGEAGSALCPLGISMPSISLGELAFSALRFVPVPMLVLDSLKTVVMVNEAMGTLLGMTSGTDEAEGTPAVLNRLRGQSLSQVGVDMVQDGRPVWIDWEQFLESLVSEMDADTAQTPSHNRDQNAFHMTGDVTPRITAADKNPLTELSTQPSGQSAVVEVIITRKDVNRAFLDKTARAKSATSQTRAKMIITILKVEDYQTYFSLTYTHTDPNSAPIRYPISRKSVAKTHLLEAAERNSFSGSNASSSAGASDFSSPPLHLSPSAVSLSSTPFPPFGPPQRTSINSAPSILQKIIVMKDALIDSTETAVFAMWKDGSAAFPNRAARKLFRQAADLDHCVNGHDLLPAWRVYDEDFSAELEPSEFPISVLLRTETPFSGRRIGMYDDDGNKRVFDVLGEIIRDEITGEVLAGVVTCRDVTNMALQIARIKEEDDERFRLICDAMPQLVWTTTAEGYHDFYNSRWYEYTGLTEEQSRGEGWMNAIHPVDLEESSTAWNHSLRTGEPYVTEYRCLSKEGEWKWFIGRALPLRSKETGQIEKWFGTCTDANEILESRHEAKRTRQQLLSVIAHAKVTVFQVDLQRRITMLEGALIEDAPGGRELGPRWYIGQDVHRVFSILSSKEPRQDGRQKFLEPIDTIITGQPTEDLQEHVIDGRFYRTRFLPVFGKKDKEAKFHDGDLEGVISVILDVSELKRKEADIERQAREKQRLVASEAAAKEASKLKGQFLANMSHEIRTPITGVIGMAELMLDLDLGEEQREYTENIYRSANALLTVINDILDFSKVESGRLDIEEVQFSLSVVVQDVNKMLSFAAERKSLEFSSDIASDIENDLVVLGDPGRVRQIITNLLTNSIKFTNQGYVKFSVLKEKETSDMIEIRFVIEDTGIGITEDVRKRLFQPFSQGDASTARKFGGTGLGLTICKSLLDLMRGRMTLESTIGHGTTATFWIPFHKPSDSQASLVRIDPLSDRLQSDMSVSCNTSEYNQLLNTCPAEITASGLIDRFRSTRPGHKKSLSNGGQTSGDEVSPDRSKIHVLVVEDNAINQQIATKTIEKLGFTVSAAWNGREALDYLTAAQEGHKPKPSIILMDVQMPVIDGYKCTHLLRHHLPYKTYIQDVPIIAMTASAIQGDREKCRKAGMDDYLAKPVRGQTLEKMLDRWSARHRRPYLTSVSSEGSQMSDCSQAGEHCENADIPCVEHDENDFVDIRPNTLEAVLPTPRGNAGVQPPSRLGEWRPTAMARSDTEETAMARKPPIARNDSATGSLKRGRGSDRELAATSRDDKLFDAADARTARGQTQVSHQLPHSLESQGPRGEALTVENMERHQKEEEYKHEHRTGGR